MTEPTIAPQGLSVMGGRITALLHSRPVILQLLRFAAIGSLNTALDFIIYNYVTKSFGVTSGVALGVLGVIGFIAAIAQSYLWNRAWAFHANNVTTFQNAFRLILVGGLGFAAFVATVLGAANEAAPVFYLMIFGAFIISEIALWILFGLTISDGGGEISHQFAAFVIVSLVGLVINSTVIVAASYFLSPILETYTNEDTIKNVAKAMATGVSLVWNFLGYKMIVFKK